MTPRPISRTFLITAGLAGTIYGTYSVALPLYATATDQAVSITGLLLAIAIVSVAIGSTAAGFVVRTIGAGSLLAIGMATSALADALLLQGSVPAMVVGSVLVGSGLGFYWAGSQAVLSSQSGRPGSQQAFVNQFVIYTVGTVGGSILSGTTSSLLHAVGLSMAMSTRAGFGIGLITTGTAFWINWTRPGERMRTGRVATIVSGAGRDAVLQLADLCLVAALAFVLALAPLVLSGHFHFDSFQVGISYGAVSLAKMAGSFLAGRSVRSGRYRAPIAIILGAGAVLTLLLAVVTQPILFVLVLACATLTAGGVWPVIVDATLATVRPDRRAAMALTWSAREYPVIALATLVGGSVLGAFRTPAVLYLIAAALLAAAALASRMLSSAPSDAQTVNVTRSMS